MHTPPVGNDTAQSIVSPGALTTRSRGRTLELPSTPPTPDAGRSWMGLSVTSSTPQSNKATAYLVAPHRHRRGWLERRRTSRRGRFELALIGGGALALGLPGTLPGGPPSRTAPLLVRGGPASSLISPLVGVAPALATAF